MFHPAIRFETRTRIAVALLTIAVATMSVPRADTGEEDPIVSPVKEFALGNVKMERLLEQYPLNEDGSLWLRVTGIGRRISAVSDRPDLVFEFLVLRTDTLQAWSFSNGTICISDALLALHETDDQLAFTLAHEMAHVILRHDPEMLEQLHVMDAGSSIASDEADKLLTRYSRNNEREADRFGALFCVRAGFKFSAGVELLKRLSAHSRPSREREDDATHPDYATRIAELKSFRSELERAAKMFDEGVRHLMTEADPRAAIQRFKLFLAEYPNSSEGRINLGAAYLALVRADAGTLQSLAEPLPIVPEQRTILIRGGFDRVDVEHAQANLRMALRLNADHPYCRAGLALAHIRLGELDQAGQLLSEALAARPDDPVIVLLMGNLAYLSEDFPGASARYLEALELRTGWPDAIWNGALAQEQVGNLSLACEGWDRLAESERFGTEARYRLEDRCN